jgi:hypothetical protein
LKNYYRISQVVLWLLLYLLMLTYGWSGTERYSLAFGRATIPVLSYVTLVYGNDYFFHVSFGQTKNWPRFIALSFGLLIALLLVRMTAEFYLLHKLCGVSHFFDFSFRHFAFTLVTLLIAYFFGILLRTSQNYLTLLKKQDDIKSQQLQAELALLKAQVQPHFLFNTLNNIYYLAYRKSDQTTDVIAKLAELMRYFLTESLEEQVKLATEIQFIRDYIELERIRIPNGIRVDWDCRGNLDAVRLPPMLLMPLVENVFKHGVEKGNADNWVHFSLSVDEKNLSFETRNPVRPRLLHSPGTGLMNLTKRLELLFATQSCLTLNQLNDQFIARLDIPLTELK